MGSRWKPDWAFAVLSVADVGCFLLAGFWLILAPYQAFAVYRFYRIAVPPATYLVVGNGVVLCAFMGGIVLLCLCAGVAVRKGAWRTAFGVAPLVVLVLLLEVHALLLFLPFVRGLVP